MNHYFTDNRHLTENRKDLSFRFWCFSYCFTTDNGVFSKDAIDFGSRVFLDTMLKINEMGPRILDVGCGYGTLGIILKKHYPDSYVEMVDVNPRALELTIHNAKQNDVEVYAHLSNIYENVNGTFSDVVTNPPIRAGKKVIYEIFEKAYDHLEVNGSLWVVIRKQQGAMSAVKKIKEVFGNCDIVAKEKGYFILRSKKC